MFTTIVANESTNRSLNDKEIVMRGVSKRSIVGWFVAVAAVFVMLTPSGGAYACDGLDDDSVLCAPEPDPCTSGILIFCLLPGN